MKKIRFLIILFILSLILPACSGSESTSGQSGSETTGDETETSKPSETKTEDPTTEAPQDELVFFTEDISDNLWSFGESLIPTSKGFYRLEGSDERYLYFYDAQGEKVLVCGKPDCKHHDETCDAYLPANTFTYWGGRFYYVTDKREMISMRPDASDRRLERSNIGEYDPDLYNGFVFMDSGFHEHYYFCRMISDKLVGIGEDDMTWQAEARILVYDILKPQDDPVCLSELITREDSAGSAGGSKTPVYLSGFYASLQKPEGGKIYLLGIEGDPYVEGAPRTLFSWSLSEKKLEKLIDIPDEAANRIDVRNDMLYYQVPGEGVFRVSIYGGESEKIISVNPYLNIVQFDDQYIYISVETDYQIYDLDGKLLNSLPLTREMQSWNLIILSKVENTLLFGTRLRGERKIVYTLDYTKIGTDELQWEAFP